MSENDKPVFYYREALRAMAKLWVERGGNSANIRDCLLELEQYVRAEEQSNERR